MQSSIMSRRERSQFQIQEQQGQSYLQQGQKQSNNQKNISLTLEIQDFKLITEEPKSKKYKDLLSSLKRDYFKELSRENELILAQGWNPVIPQSFDSKIEEVQNYTVPRYTVWKLNDYLLEMAHRQKELSETITKCQDQIAKDTWKIQYQELEPKYNEIYEQYNLLKKYCQKYFEAIDQIKVIKDNSIIVQPINQQSRIIQKDLRKEYSNQQESIQEQNLLFIQEYFVFKNQITQSKGKLEQIPIQQGFNQPENKQSKSKIQEIPYDSGQIQGSQEIHEVKQQILYSGKLVQKSQQYEQFQQQYPIRNMQEQQSGDIEIAKDKYQQQEYEKEIQKLKGYVAQLEQMLEITLYQQPKQIDTQQQQQSNVNPQMISNIRIKQTETRIDYSGQQQEVQSQTKSKNENH